MFQFPNNIVKNKDFLDVVKKMGYTEKAFNSSYKYWLYAWCVWKSKSMLNSNSRILDAGPGGKGYMLDYCSKYIKCETHATDLTFKQKKLNHINGLKFNKASLLDTSYVDDFFDVIYCISVIEHMKVSDRNAFFNEMYRVLKPNGLMFLSLIETQHLMKGQKENPAVKSGAIIFVPMSYIKGLSNFTMMNAGKYNEHPNKNNKSIYWNNKKGKRWTEYCCMLQK